MDIALKRANQRQHLEALGTYAGIEYGGYPTDEAPPVGRWHTEHLSNHGHRQRQGKVAHDVHAAPRGYPVQEFFTEGLDARPQRLYEAGRECLLHQATQTGMVRFIGVEHVLNEWPEHPGEEHLFAKKPSLRRLIDIFCKSLVFQCEHNIVITSDKPGLVPETNGYPDHRSFRAKLIINKIWIGFESWISQINIGCFGHREGMLILREPIQHRYGFRWAGLLIAASRM